MSLGEGWPGPALKVRISKSECGGKQRVAAGQLAII